MPIELRQATPADLAIICALLESYYGEFDIWVRDEPAYVAAALEQTPLGYFLALAEGVPAGIVQLRPLPQVPSAAECKRLYVLPAYRGQGLAIRLMDLAEQAARDAGCRWIYLDSKDEFRTAIALYRRRGYEEIPRFNDNAQATIFLRKDLRGAS